MPTTSVAARRWAVVVAVGLLLGLLVSPVGAEASSPSATASTPAPRILGGGFDNPDAIASDGTHVWVANAGNGTVSELNAVTGRYVRTVFGSKYDFRYPCAIGVAASHVFVANCQGDSVTELDASSGALVAVLSGSNYAFDTPSAIAVDRTHVWVGNLGASVTEINASTGGAVTEVGGMPYLGDGGKALASNGVDLFVVNVGGGSVTELDEATGAVVRVISSYLYRFHDLVAAAFHGSRLWVLGGSLTEINASTGALVGVISTAKDKVGDPIGMVADSSDLWIAHQYPKSVVELNAATGALVRTVSGGLVFPSSTAIACDGVHVWVANGPGSSDGDAVTDLNATTGRLVRITSGAGDEFSSLRDVISDATDAWVLNTAGDGSITEIDNGTGAVVRVISGTEHRIYLGGGAEYEGIVSDGHDLWVGGEVSRPYPSAVIEINASDGAVVRVITGEQYRLNWGGAIATNGRDVWVTNSFRNSVTEFSASTGALVRVMTSFKYGFDAPVGIAVSGPDVWVTNRAGGSMTEINARTGAVERLLQSPAYPLQQAGQVVTGGGRIWVRSNAGITEIDASTGLLVGSLALFGAMASDGTHLWVTGPPSSVIELDEATGAQLAVISGPSYGFDDPSAIHSNGSDVWVTDPILDMVTEFPVPD